MLRQAIADSQMTKAMEDSKRAEYVPPGQPTNAPAYPRITEVDGAINHAEPARSDSEIAPDKGNGESGPDHQVL